MKSYLHKKNISRPKRYSIRVSGVGSRVRLKHSSRLRGAPLITIHNISSFLRSQIYFNNISNSSAQFISAYYVRARPVSKSPATCRQNGRWTKTRNSRKRSRIGCIFRVNKLKCLFGAIFRPYTDIALLSYWPYIVYLKPETYRRLTMLVLAMRY